MSEVEAINKETIAIDSMEAMLPSFTNMRKEMNGIWPL